MLEGETASGIVAWSL